jgi:hypothetical protein
MRRLNKDTFKHVECFITVSRILQTFTQISLPLTEKCNDRLNRFAKKIHPANLLEGLTLAGTYIKYSSNDPPTSLFHCHIDGFNSPTLPSNYIIIVGMVRFINGRLIRISLIGYARKSVDDFLRRMELFKPVLEAIDHYYRGLPKTSLVYDASTLTDEKVSYYVTDKLHVTKENTFILRPANLNINCYLSIYVYAILKVKNQFALTT